MSTTAAPNPYSVIRCRAAEKPRRVLSPRPTTWLSGILVLLGSGMASLNLLAIVQAPVAPEPSCSPHPALVASAETFEPGCLSDYLERVRRGEAFDVEEATTAVFASTVHSDERRIGWDENWLQWLLGICYPPLARTQDSTRLMAGGNANCSERSQILKTVAEQAGHSCRFVGLNGHVVLEVCANGTWRVADPDYGVAYPFDLAQLAGEEGPAIIRQRLISKGFPAAMVDRYIEIFRSADDNVVLEPGQFLSPRLHTIEWACGWLVWIIPGACIWLGYLLARRRLAVRDRWAPSFRAD